METTTQCGKILKMLRANQKHGVENYKFPQIGILRYSARIDELRKEGHNILAERQIINGRFTGVWRYFLIEEPAKHTVLGRFKRAVA